MNKQSLRRAMDRPKIVAILTGVISVAIAVGYLAMVQVLNTRDFQPAPIERTP